MTLYSFASSSSVQIVPATFVSGILVQLKHLRGTEEGGTSFFMTGLGGWTALGNPGGGGGGGPPRGGGGGGGGIFEFSKPLLPFMKLARPGGGVKLKSLIPFLASAGMLVPEWLRMCSSFILSCWTICNCWPSSLRYVSISAIFCLASKWATVSRSNFSFNRLRAASPSSYIICNKNQI